MEHTWIFEKIINYPKMGVSGGQKGVKMTKIRYIKVGLTVLFAFFREVLTLENK